MFSKRGDNVEVEGGDGKNQGRAGFSFKDMMSKASEYIHMDDRHLQSYEKVW